MLFRPIVMILFFNCVSAFSQDSIVNTYHSFDDIVVELVTHTNNESLVEEMSVQLLDLFERKIDINNATEDELNQLFWLTDFQKRSLLEYISKKGALKSSFEIAYIKGFTDKDADLLIPFIRIEAYENKKYKRTPRISHFLLFRTQSIIETQKGYLVNDSLASNRFKGDSFRHYLRYTFEVDKHISAGFTAEKDAGEEFFKGSNKYGFDFYSAHVQLFDYKFFKTIVIGDYQASFGQGLVVSSGFSMGKSGLATELMNSPRGIYAYKSNDENRFFRGVATTMRYKPMLLSLWFSTHKVDANIGITDTIQKSELEVSYLQSVGLHSTNSEIEDEDALTISTVGGNLAFKKTDFHLGCTFNSNFFSLPIEYDIKPHNYNSFRGKSSANIGFDYRYRAGNYIFFGEEARSQNNGMAFLNGIETFTQTNLRLSLLHRYYQPNYQSLNANAFGENSQNSNESGVYAGATISPFASIDISTFIDIFRFPWLRMDTDMPSSGRDFLLQSAYFPTNDFRITIQYRNKIKEQNNNDSLLHFNKILQSRTDKVKIHMNYDVNRTISLQSKVEIINYSIIKQQSKGYYLSQNISFKLWQLPVKTIVSYAMFDTDDFNSRIYAYENDLLYTFSIPMFMGQGSKKYVVIQYNFNKSTVFSIKYNIVTYQNQSKIGSGLYEISGRNKSEIKAQLLLRY